MRGERKRRERGSVRAQEEVEQAPCVCSTLGKPSDACVCVYTHTHTHTHTHTISDLGGVNNCLLPCQIFAAM